MILPQVTPTILVSSSFAWYKLFISLYPSECTAWAFAMTGGQIGENVTLAKSYNIAWLVLIGITPFCFMAIFYGKVILHLRREILPRQHGSLATRKSRQKVTKMLLTITIIYGICLIPNLILYVVWYYALEAEIMYTINEVLLVLILINSCANPFVYAAQSRVFRRSMKDVLCPCKNWSINRVNISLP